MPGPVHEVLQFFFQAASPDFLQNRHNPVRHVGLLDLRFLQQGDRGVAEVDEAAADGSDDALILVAQ